MKTNAHYDVIVIGSGFGGSMTAYRMASQGYKVLILERGDWVKRGPHNWGKRGSIDLTPHYDHSTEYHVKKGGNKEKMGVYAAVGGPSVFYGGVSFRFRKEDFHPPQNIVGKSDAAWPIAYDDLEPYYGQAEELLEVCGDEAEDITAPFRSKPLPFKAHKSALITQKIEKAARELGLHPSRLPLAINHYNKARQACQLCTTCDTFACAIGAKNDLDKMILSNPILNNKIDIKPNMVVNHLVREKGRITRVEAIDKKNEQVHLFSSDLVILSAGALASPHLLLQSGLAKENPAGDLIGRFLMRHVNAIIFGIFPGRADKEQRFHKELAIMDHYHNHPDYPQLEGKVGSLQQVSTPPAGIVESVLPTPIGKVLAKGVKLLTGLLAIAEDQPQYDNRLWIDPQVKEKYGFSKAMVSHEYSRRDQEAIKALSTSAKKVMKKSGALTTYTHHIRTFSHAVGTVRMGIDENTSPLDKYCQFRGTENLYVIDGSFMPTAAAVNPSLTISANALRVADHILST